jgi:hypothetical protein
VVTRRKSSNCSTMGGRINIYNRRNNRDCNSNRLDELDCRNRLFRKELEYSATVTFVSNTPAITPPLPSITLDVTYPSYLPTNPFPAFAYNPSNPLFKEIDMLKTRWILVLLNILFLASTTQSQTSLAAGGTTYYVSSSTGSDSDNGLTPPTSP